MWISAFLFYLITIDIASSTVDYLQHPVKSCHIGDVVENECIKCLCTTKNVFECHSRNCDKNNIRTEIEATGQICLPNQLYVLNLITCICTKDGRWPHRSCQENFHSLPSRSVTKHTCDPDSYVIVDCNVCRCGSDGNIIRDRCTRNSCEDEIKRRVNPGTNSVYSSCEIKNWYSLAPCQFCFCVNQNKLVCNTGNYYSKKLELGSYNLRVCGKELIREAIELIPDSQRALRLGLSPYNKTTTTVKKLETTSTTATTKMYVNVQNQIAVEVNREKNENRTNPNSKPSKEEDLLSSSDKEYYSDTEEIEMPKPTVPRSPVSSHTLTTVIRTTTEGEAKAPSTKFPFEEGDEMLNESDLKNTDDENDDDSNEIMVELSQTPQAPQALQAPVTVTTTTKHPAEISLHSINDDQLKELAMEARSGESYQYVGNTLKINLPKVLNKVFQLALRKSMVSLSSETKCVPGTTSMNNCNMCFCLKNSKMLCTTNKCDKEIKQ